MSTGRWTLALLLVLGYGLMCLAVLWRHRRLQRRHEALAQAPAPVDRAPLLLLHASQTGQAEALAWRAAQALHAGGVAVKVMPLGALSLAQLSSTQRMLLILSTTGEGDAPDSAQSFVRGPMAQTQVPDLSALQIGVLALGDRRYARFCAFAHRVHQWLLSAGARDAQPLIEVDAMDASPLARWQALLPTWGAGSEADVDDMAEASGSAWSDWRLARREVLNPGSPGAPVFHLELVPVDEGATCHWQAGDLVQVSVPGDERHPRAYSIASLPEDGHLHLMVRLHRREDGAPGRCSSWLGQHLALGGSVRLRLQAHPGFRSSDHAHRPLILIGSGTGLAGLLAHLRARARQWRHQEAPPVWLLYGERQAAHDAHYSEELLLNQGRGVLQHLDRCFSRDATPGHVQSLLAQQSARLRHWLAQGAALYVCGSRQGMGAAVDAQLRALLGDAALEALAQAGRYRRDVY